MTDRYSHPGATGEDPVPLISHLQDTATRVSELIPADTMIGDGAPLAEIIERLGLIHDIGKATTWFQQHINLMDGSPDGPTEHSPIGAFAGYYVLERSGYSEHIALAGLVAVASHHGTLPNVAESVFKRASPGDERSANYGRYQELLEVAENIDEHAPAMANEAITQATDDGGSWQDFFHVVREGEIFDGVKRLVSRRGLRPSSEQLPDRFYDEVLQIWSGLCLADKTSASQTPPGSLGFTRPSKQRLKSFIEGLGDDSDDTPARVSRLNEYRGQARKSVVENTTTFVGSETSVATLTLPTGLGKTLSGLDTALTLRDRTDRNRIVYALPFTSIIDQVADEIGSIYDSDGTDELLTIHHHLAETVTDVDDTDADAYVERLLGESWQSGITVSTYVQLFESLAGPRNAQSLKLPALYRSVIILDEPQSLPHEWWPLIQRLTTILTDEYDALVIAMTATQPRLFEAGGQEPFELVEKPERYFQEFERVEYTFDESVESVVADDIPAVDHRRATERLVAVVERGESLLCICNTIDSARTVTRALGEDLAAVSLAQVYGTQLREGDFTTVGDLVDTVLEEGSGPILLHLSTRLRPRDRLRFIKAAKRLLEREATLVVVSTQLVEAGVDISFENVFRDMAPIDSIVQAAGRCNRSFKRERGTVTVWQLAPPEGKSLPPSEAVYNRFGDSLLNVTWKALQNAGVATDQRAAERTIAWDAVSEYYRILREERDVGNQTWVDHLDRAEAADLGRLSLIDSPRQVDVLVTRTDAEGSKVDGIRPAWERGDFDHVDSILDELRSCRISVPVYDEGSEEAEAVAQLPHVHPESDLRHLDTNGRYEHFFDDSLGFERSSGVDHRFL